MTRVERRLPLWVMSGVVAIALLRLWVAGHTELIPAEAYYWNYFAHPALSYFDHPPAVAWIIAPGVRLFGDTAVGVRFGAMVLSLASAALVFDVARRWVGSPAAWWAVALFTLLPVFSVTGMLAMPDAPQTFCTLLTMFGVTMAVKDHRAVGWLWAGVGFGGALLSRYTAVMLAPSILTLLLVNPAYRHWLRRPHPWLSFGLGVCLFTPVILWNSQHDWASFRFQSGRLGVPADAMALSASMFWVSQIAAVTPPGLLLFGRALRRRDAAGMFAACLAIPVFAVFLLASFRTDVHIDWTAPAYLALLPVAAAVMRERSAQSPHWRRTVWITGAVIVVGFCVAASTLTLGRPDVLLSSHVGGWKQLAAEVARARQQLQTRTGQAPFVVGADKYPLAAELGFYMRAPDDTVNTFALGADGLGFRYWTDLQRFAGRPAVIVLRPRDALWLNVLHQYFETVEAPRRLEIPTLGSGTRVVYLIDALGYRIPRADQRDAAR